MTHRAERSARGGALLACLFFIALACGVGYELGRIPARTQLAPELARIAIEHEALIGELDAVRQQALILERDRAIERETVRVLQSRLEAAQEVRLEQARELSYLKRLVQAGDKGAVRAHDLRLSAQPRPRRYGYDFLLTQLVDGVGQVEGRVVLIIEGVRGDEPARLRLDELTAEPATIDMDFEHYQHCSGWFMLPEDFVPQLVVIEVEPDGKRLAATSASFPWPLELID
ncbi:hypothetical protein MARPU_01300 [Marichromatium purpuratum 984]|uniref:Uncharacterized protein n=1 Tax=Marichromatium purpuratum 984 TaxID=765910 RepID=W0E8G3_MARPU|nr:DUF6776 family protein [Marichromatium purpuratum]AHF05341.1 hypothetical protein MARPU_01300 [Marichromatium purpuratum 984]